MYTPIISNDKSVFYFSYLVLVDGVYLRRGNLVANQIAADDMNKHKFKIKL